MGDVATTSGTTKAMPAIDSTTERDTKTVETEPVQYPVSGELEVPPPPPTPDVIAERRGVRPLPKPRQRRASTAARSQRKRRTTRAPRR